MRPDLSLSSWLILHWEAEELGHDILFTVALKACTDNPTASSKLRLRIVMESVL